MSFLTILLAETAHVELPMPTWAYGLIALVLFAALGFVIWTYRDVANRHAQKSQDYAASHGGSSAGSGH